MKGCKNCPAYAKCTATYQGSACAALRCTYGLDDDPEITTNADRIRAMSDEELAELLTFTIKGVVPCPIYASVNSETAYITKRPAIEESLQWLQQPAEEGDGNV